MASDDLVVVRSYVNLVDAEVGASALEAAGIPVTIHKDDCGGLRPHLWLSGVELLVRAEDATTAHELLGTDAEVSAEDLAAEDAGEAVGEGSRDEDDTD
jgi:hypothetical protein